MNTSHALLISGTALLSVAALLGFAQHHARHHSERERLWRVVHNGGTAGAVQLIACGAAWDRIAGDAAGAVWAAWLAAGLIAATWAFFLGPLARALGHTRVGDLVNRVGGLVALPSYLGLPALLFA